MKKTLSVTALLLAVIMIAMCCVACGDDDKKSSITPPLTGSYTCVGVTGGSADAQSLFEGCMLVINSDNFNGTLTVKGKSMPVRVNSVNHKAQLNGQWYPYTFDGTTLVVGDSSENFTFRKN